MRPNSHARSFHTIYDGDGQVARVTRQVEGTTVVYNLRSTALGGAVVSQLKPQANALDVRQDIIPLGDGAEARRDVGVTGETVTWSHEDPAGTTVQEGGVSSLGGANATFLNPLVELDPVRANVGWADPAQFEEPLPPPDETSPEGRIYNNPLRPGTTCFNNFVLVECRQLMDDISWHAVGMRLRIDRLESGTSWKRLIDLRNTPAGEVEEVDKDEIVSVFTSLERKDWYSQSFEGYIWGWSVTAAVQSQNPNRPDRRRVREQEAIDRAAQMLQGDCARFMERMLRRAAEVNNILTSTGNGAVYNINANTGLNMYQGLLNSNLILSLRERQAQDEHFTMPDTAEGLTLHTTTIPGSNIPIVTTTVTWRESFYRLDLDDAARQTLHESSHPIAVGFTDRVLANAARFAANEQQSQYGESDAERDRASSDINRLIRIYCQ